MCNIACIVTLIETVIVYWHVMLLLVNGYYLKWSFIAVLLSAGPEPYPQHERSWVCGEC